VGYGGRDRPAAAALGPRRGRKTQALKQVKTMQGLRMRRRGCRWGRLRYLPMELFSFSITDQAAGEGSLDEALVTARWALWHCRARVGHGSWAAGRADGDTRGAAQTAGCTAEEVREAEGTRRGQWAAVRRSEQRENRRNRRAGCSGIWQGVPGLGVTGV